MPGGHWPCNYNNEIILPLKNKDLALIVYRIAVSF